MPMGSSPAYDATTALSHALRTIAEGGTKTKDLTQALAQIQSGAIAAPTPSAAMTTGPVTVTTAVPLTYRVEPKGKNK